MIEVPIFGSSYIYGDKILVVHNNQLPESTLKKKRNYIFYHYVRESVAIGESLTGNIGTNKNCAASATKVLYSAKSKFYMSNLLYNIYDDL